MVLVKVGEPVVHEHLSLPVLLERELQIIALAFLLILPFLNNLRAGQVRLFYVGTVRVVDLDLPDVVREPEHADADGDEGDADHEEGGQDGAGRQDGLPRGQALLLEGAV